MKNQFKSALDYTTSALHQSPVVPYIQDVILFGSYAKKSYNKESDIDLLLILNPEIKNNKEYKIPLRLLRSEVNTDNINNPEIDLKIVFGSEWKTNRLLFFKNIKKDGISVWK